MTGSAASAGIWRFPLHLLDCLYFQASGLGLTRQGISAYPAGISARDGLSDLQLRPFPHGYGDGEVRGLPGEGLAACPAGVGGCGIPA